MRTVHIFSQDDVMLCGAMRAYKIERGPEITKRDVEYHTRRCVVQVSQIIIALHIRFLLLMDAYQYIVDHRYVARLW